MKIYNKSIWAALSLVMFASCADDDLPDFKVGMPAQLESYLYLNDYGVLKSYINSSTDPNLKLGAAVEAADFLAKGQVYSLAVSNFNDVTAGNAMKYSSVVADDGSMDFATVRNFVAAAKEANISVHGHTLCWHSQQNTKYLNSIIADKPVEVDPDEAVEVQDALVTYSDYTDYPFYRMSELPIINDDGELEITNTKAVGDWEVQYFVGDGIATTVGVDYQVTALIKGSAAGSLKVNMGDWGGSSSSLLSFTDEWTEVTITLSAVPAASSFVVFQSGGFVGTLQVKWLKVTHADVSGGASWWTNIVANGDCEGDDTSCFFSTEPATGGPNASTFGAAGTGADGAGRAIVVKSGDNPVNAWDTQFFVRLPKKLESGTKYRYSMKYKADADASSESQAHGEPGGYQHWQMLSPNPSFTTEWQEKTWEGTISGDQAGSEGMQTIAFNLAVSKTANTYYFDDISFEIEETGDGIPLTPEEKADTLTWALDNWIAGMMDACDGYVTAWDVVNEAVSGGPVADGKYGLWSVVNGNVSEADAANNFYWRDYLGDEFVRTVVASARKHGPADMKLFMNDYNLESDWDDNMKLKSLIKWIEFWESDGVTKIDGIGSQMHVSYHMNPETQKRKEEHVVKMFELLAASGKLVKITELDMGLVDETGGKVLTENVTEEQHKAMAEYYKFIISKYFEIIPANQRFGITQWAVTDSPSQSFWRADEPIGLWSLDYQRKHVYSGFADGLAGK